MSNTASTITLGVILVTVVLAQAYWIGRALDDLRSEMHRGFDSINARLDRIETRLAEHGERITRLEEQR